VWGVVFVIALITLIVSTFGVVFINCLLKKSRMQEWRTRDVGARRGYAAAAAGAHRRGRARTATTPATTRPSAGGASRQRGASGAAMIIL
jgi:hypothetical protein